MNKQVVSIKDTAAARAKAAEQAAKGSIGGTGTDGSPQLYEGEGQSDTGTPESDESDGPPEEPMPDPKGKQRLKKADKDNLIPHPVMMELLADSTVQKTVRLQPMDWLDYKETCKRGGFKVDFNAHANEAMRLWIGQQKKLLEAKK